MALPSRAMLAPCNPVVSSLGAVTSWSHCEKRKKPWTLFSGNNATMLRATFSRKWLLCVQFPPKISSHTAQLSSHLSAEWRHCGHFWRLFLSLKRLLMRITLSRRALCTATDSVSMIQYSRLSLKSRYHRFTDELSSSKHQSVMQNENDSLSKI